jgi:hypothetical protein
MISTLQVELDLDGQVGSQLRIDLQLNRLHDFRLLFAVSDCKFTTADYLIEVFDGGPEEERLLQADQVEDGAGRVALSQR